MSEDEIKGLIARLEGGEDAVLGELFCAFRDRLRRTVQFRMDPRLLGRIDAQDVLQESYLAAAQRLDHFRRSVTTSLFVWLRTITMQSLIDATRHHLGAQKRDVNAEVPLDSRGRCAEGTAASLAGYLLGQLTSPTRAAVRAELAERLTGILDDLSELDREILILRHFEELTNNEAAQVLGIHKAASTNRYIRALGRLRAVLAELPEFADFQA
jgi:RNA polymerase sigma-70 factor (ECF subfamily)